MQKEYLNEEEYQKTRKKLKNISIIILCIAVPLFIAGIVLTVIGFGDFDGPNLFMIGGFMMTIGFAGIGIGLGLLFTTNARKIQGFIANSTVPVAKEATQEMAPAYGEVAKEVVKGIKGEEKQPCPKCGEENAKTAKFCSNCGEKLKVELHCPYCNEKITARHKYCPNCGKQVKE